MKESPKTKRQKEKDETLKTDSTQSADGKETGVMKEGTQYLDNEYYRRLKEEGVLSASRYRKGVDKEYYKLLEKGDIKGTREHLKEKPKKTIYGAAARGHEKLRSEKISDIRKYKKEEMEKENNKETTEPKNDSIDKIVDFEFSSEFKNTVGEVLDKVNKGAEKEKVLTILGLIVNGIRTADTSQVYEQRMELSLTLSGNVNKDYTPLSTVLDSMAIKDYIGGLQAKKVESEPTKETGDRDIIDVYTNEEQKTEWPPSPNTPGGIDGGNPVDVADNTSIPEPETKENITNPDIPPRSAEDFLLKISEMKENNKERAVKHFEKFGVERSDIEGMSKWQSRFTRMKGVIGGMMGSFAGGSAVAIGGKLLGGAALVAGGWPLAIATMGGAFAGGYFIRKHWAPRQINAARAESMARSLNKPIENSSSRYDIEKYDVSKELKKYKWHKGAQSVMLAVGSVALGYGVHEALNGLPALLHSTPPHTLHGASVSGDALKDYDFSGAHIPAPNNIDLNYTVGGNTDTAWSMVNNLFQHNGIAQALQEKVADGTISPSQLQEIQNKFLPDLVTDYLQPGSGHFDGVLTQNVLNGATTHTLHIGDGVDLKPIFSEKVGDMIERLSQLPEGVRGIVAESLRALAR